MSLRVVARLLIVAAVIILGSAVVMRPPARTSWILACGAALLICVPAVPIAALRWTRPPPTSMMRLTAARLGRRSGMPGTVHYEWVSLTRVARCMWLAAIAAEDGYFRHHSGFDWESIRLALKHNKVHERKRGGSTITQQLAKNLFLWPGRSWTRKIVEGYLTILIEALWPKRRILEVYLNVVQFGDDVFGVQVAAQRYFRKSAGELTESEAAQLAAALPNPVTYRVDSPSHQMRFRQSWILLAMRRLGDAYLQDL
jgi:monofunctional biosynthetic peptidoglycan transglycosylase